VSHPRTHASLTERRNPRSRGLDLKSTRQILQILNREDALVPAAVAREIPAIARAVDRVACMLGHGGRLLYVGAGTSGRLAALDASELPPTFGVSPQMVRATIAGGPRALSRAIERAEDSQSAAARDLGAARLTAKDVVVGLSASGTTPYVLSALRYARQRGAFTIAVTGNRQAPIRRLARITIAPDPGPEVIAGSTRMKAGTAQKLVLNLLSTAVMVRLGHVYDNWMINIALKSQKLRRRARRILQEAAGASPSAAEHALRQAGHDLRVALLMLKTGSRAPEARQCLAAARGNLREALGAAGSGRQARRRKN
jgi:N-acetylmuramic acid 6-phosphate etherase